MSRRWFVSGKAEAFDPLDEAILAWAESGARLAARLRNAPAQTQLRVIPGGAPATTTRTRTSHHHDR